MRILSRFLLVLATAGGLSAQEPSSREAALDNLLSERGPARELADAIANARKAGVGEQAILEARFLYHVDRRDDAALAALLPEFLARKDTFKPADSAIFAVKDDWLAVVEYIQAMAALEKDDAAGFKQHITEAFWLSPRQAAAFAPHIERLRLEQAMRAVKIDFQSRFLPLAGGDAVTLQSLLGEGKAMILHFWSPANAESADSLPDYVATATALGKNGIAMVSLLTDGSARAAARTALKPLGATPPGAWLLDRADDPLARPLRVQSLPIFVLVSREGRILFNGHPADDAFWEALSGLDPALVRPATAERTE